jgi:chromosome segregation ATPase
MSDETEGRLADIQASVHRIDTAMGGLERRLDRTDGRIGELERDVIEVRAEQRGAEKVTNAEHRLLHDKIDGLAVGQASIDRRLGDHLEQEEEERKVQTEVMRSTNARLGSMLWSLVLLFLGGFGTVLWFLMQKQVE